MPPHATTQSDHIRFPYREEMTLLLICVVAAKCSTQLHTDWTEAVNLLLEINMGPNWKARGGGRSRAGPSVCGSRPRAFGA